MVMMNPSDHGRYREWRQHVFLVYRQKERHQLDRLSRMSLIKLEQTEQEPERGRKQAREAPMQEKS